jgi:hypothetical protein
LPASLSPSAAALAHRRVTGEARRRGAARKAERAMMEDMVPGSERRASVAGGVVDGAECWALGS